TLIPNGIHHPPIEDGRLLPNSVKRNPFHFIDYCIYYKKRGFVINCHASFTYEIFSRVKVFLVEHNK
ncbi:hypothetical protein, partial [Enterococcus faecium]